jgi:hypothetical protein
VIVVELSVVPFELFPRPLPPAFEVVLLPLPPAFDVPPLPLPPSLVEPEPLLPLPCDPLLLPFPFPFPFPWESELPLPLEPLPEPLVSVVAGVSVVVVAGVSVAGVAVSAGSAGRVSVVPPAPWPCEPPVVAPPPELPPLEVVVPIVPTVVGSRPVPVPVSVEVVVVAEGSSPLAGVVPVAPFAADSARAGDTGADRVERLAAAAVRDGTVTGAAASGRVAITRARTGAAETVGATSSAAMRVIVSLPVDATLWTRVSSPGTSATAMRSTKPGSGIDSPVALTTGIGSVIASMTPAIVPRLGRRSRGPALRAARLVTMIAR